MNPIDQTLQESSAIPLPAAPVLPTVPGYEILEEIGRGGMGVVYKARQAGLHRLVALKMILSGDLAGENDRARFRAEAEAVAALQHPNVVQIHEVGERDGLPFFSLEFVGGGSLAQWLSEQASVVNPRDAAALVETLARAMHAAHQSGIVHRDLKPGNILLAEARGERQAASGNTEKPESSSASSLAFCLLPLASCVPKITDFGLAKRLDEASRTQEGAVLGTPSYMAPEQAGGKVALVGPPADIYALGAILYELLTGRPPFKAETAWDTITQVIADDPVPPTRLQTRAPRDLETICLKCLRKEPPRRYDSALTLAEDLRRFLDGEPIRARPAGWGERVVKWARRRPALAALAGVSGMSLVALLIGGLLYNARLRTALHETEEARKEADRHGKRARDALSESEDSLLHSRIARANLEWDTGNTRAALVLLDECPPERRRLEWDLLRGLCRTSRDVWRVSEVEVLRVAVSPDGRHVLTAEGHSFQQTRKGEVCLWDRDTGRKRYTFKEHTGAVADLGVSPDGVWVASASYIQDLIGDYRKGNREPSPPRGEVFVWKLDGTGQPRKLDGCCGSVSFTARGDRLATAGLDGTVRVWDTKTWRDPVILRQMKGREGPLSRVLVSSDDRHVLALVDASEPTLVRWDLRTREMLPPLPNMIREVRTLAVSPDSRRIALGGRDQNVSVWEDDRLRWTLTGHKDTVVSLAFSPDGRWLASAANDQTARLWDLETGKEVCVLRGHEGNVHAVTFAPARPGLDPFLATGGQDGCVRLWTPLSEPNLVPFHGHTKGVGHVALSPDGSLLASTSLDAEEIRIWDTATRRPLRTIKARAYVLAWSPDGRHLAGGGGDAFRTNKAGEVAVWEVATGKVLYRLADHSRFVTALAWSLDGQELASACADLRAEKEANQRGEVILRDALTGKPTPSFPPNHGYVQSLALHPDGFRLALACADDTVSIHDATGAEVQTFQARGTAFLAVAFDRDGGRLAAAGAGAVFVWDLASGRELLRVHEPGRSWIQALAFTPEGDRLVLAGLDQNRAKGTLLIIDARTGREMLQLPGQSSVSLSRDGRRLASVAVNEINKPGNPRVWSASP